MIDRYILISHFDSPAIRLIPDGGFVSHGYPCFTLSATYCCFGFNILKVDN